MGRKIDAIFLDTGNTLRVVVKDPIFQHNARKQIAVLLGTKESPDEFCVRLGRRYESYKIWTRETMIQAPETELWTRWMLPDFPAERVTLLAGQLTRLWMEQGGRRTPRPDVKETIAELHQRGYKLGIIANSLSTTEIPDWLEADGLTRYFTAVVLSASLGHRKPDPVVYLEAARLAGVEPARCAYVGDNPSRDIVGSRSAGYGMVVILLETATLTKEPPKGKDRPDAIIRECKDLLTIFPPRS
jgi:HAD superfamily hydrolase (TIGR01549 family)